MFASSAESVGRWRLRIPVMSIGEREAAPAVSPLVFRGRRRTIPASYIRGGFMCLNALGHVGGSTAFRRPMPGVRSSPVLLLAASLRPIVCARRAERPLRKRASCRTAKCAGRATR
jgi:hypothetical protein